MEKKEFNTLIRTCSTNSMSFETLFEHFYPLIVMRIKCKYSSRSIEEDVAQEFFNTLLTRKSTAEVEYPTAWVYKICDNIAYDMVTSKINEEQLDAVERVTDGISIDTSIVSDDTLLQVLEQLSADDRQLLIAHIYQGYSLTELAGLANESRNTTKSRYRRALGKAQKIYKQYNKQTTRGKNYEI